MTDISRARKPLIDRILEGDGESPRTDRHAAFEKAGLDDSLDEFVDKVANHAFMVTDADIAALKSSGHSEDQIFEIAICAAIGQANRLYETGLTALHSAAEEA